MTGAGQFRDRVTVEVKQEVLDEYGGKVGAWVTFCTLWAQIERQKSFGAAAERIRAGGLDAQPVARVHFRRSEHSAAITTDMRVNCRGTYFNVVSPPQDLEGRNRTLSIMVTQSAPT